MERVPALTPEPPGNGGEREAMRPPPGKRAPRCHSVVSGEVPGRLQRVIPSRDQAPVNAGPEERVPQRTEEEYVVTKRREPTDEEIAQKAYEISGSHDPGSDEENWYRAERELRAKPTQKLKSVG